jgi:hypothetical protein
MPKTDFKPDIADFAFRNNCTFDENEKKEIREVIQTALPIAHAWGRHPTRILVAAALLLCGSIAQFVSTSALAQGSRVGSQVPTGSKVPGVPKNHIVASLAINAISDEPFQSTDTIKFSWSLQNTTPVLLTGRLALFVDQHHIQATFPRIQSLAKGASLNGPPFTVGPLPSGAHVVTLKFNQFTGLKPAPPIWGQPPHVVPTFATIGTAEQEIMIVDAVRVSTYQELAGYWAPVISQDVDDHNVRADYITTFDYDGNWLAVDNWDHLDSYDLPSAVYYWVIESPDRYFIGYAFFHPRDWSSQVSSAAGPSALVEHVNDLEGALLSIAKDSTLSHGRFEGMVTQAHGPFFTFADNNTPSSSPWFKLVSLSQDIARASAERISHLPEPLPMFLSLTSAPNDLDFVVDDFGLHPVVYLQAEGHGAYGQPLSEDIHDLDDWAPIFIDNKITDWQGADWTGVPAPPVSGAVSQIYSREGWGDGIIYHYEGTPDVLGWKGVTSSSDLARDWQVAGYELVSIKDLWDKRGNSSVFSGPGSFGPNGGAQAPWGWGDGSFFLDPAGFMAPQFGGWSGAVPQPCAKVAYLGNSFGAPPNDACVGTNKMGYTFRLKSGTPVANQLFLNANKNGISCL